MSKPKIFVFRDQPLENIGAAYYAMAEDGPVLASHFSSDDAWAKIDLGMSEHPQHPLRYTHRQKTYSDYYPDGFELEFVGHDTGQHEGLKAAKAKNKVLKETKAATAATIQ